VTCRDSRRRTLATPPATSKILGRRYWTTGHLQRRRKANGSEDIQDLWLETNPKTVE
jgi:hypothetical protein